MSWWGTDRIENHLRELSRAAAVSSAWLDADTKKAIEALEKSNDPRARGALLAALDANSTSLAAAAAKVLSSKDWHLSDRQQILVAIKMRDFPAAVKQLRQCPVGERDSELLAEIMEAGEQHLVSRVIEALTETRDPELIPVLCRGWKNKHGGVPTDVTKALEAFGPGSLPALAEALHQGDRNIAQRAVRVTGRIGGKEAVRLLIEVANSGNSGLRSEAIGALAPMGDPGTIDTLAAAVRDGTPHDRGVALKGLAKIGGPRIIGILRENLVPRAGSSIADAPHEFVEFALAELGDPYAVGPLVRAITSTVQRDIRAYEVVEAGAAGCRLAEASRKVLVELLKSRGPDVKAEDLQEAAKLADVLYVETKDRDDGRYDVVEENRVDLSAVRELAMSEIRRRKSE